MPPPARRPRRWWKATCSPRSTRARPPSRCNPATATPSARPARWPSATRRTAPMNPGRTRSCWCAKGSNGASMTSSSSATTSPVNANT
ncbi:hypothetical protein Hsero_3627 [Herbaspirillum seropedicae SmR1]|uniref:Uncharacterized protein n=1 Tax=Herbaspirillum seropedicae (strain SmR1) TaxID=757424 RepID=D8IQJ3_HERSS|nr:hypothetical protein Hsero_3627 [Herbaspirillum seropedicae SmR1]